ncbi:MAG TPA: ATP-binding protein [Burkholderiales bacterium]|nr:ATP-binding protein [Burkholderiales bacterium]
MLRRLVLLRSIVIAGQVAAIAVAVFLFGTELPVVPMGIVVALLLAMDLRAWLRLRGDRPVGDAVLFFELLVDVAGLTAQLYFSGGSTNPFVSLYLLPIAVAAAALPARLAWSMTSLAIACYTLLLFFYTPLADVGHEMHSGAFNLHVTGMWLTFIVGSILITGFVTTMSASIRTRNRELAAARERELRDEQVLALGTFAAGAAHELGTPLATLAVLGKEMQNEHGNVPGLGSDLELLRTQVDNCKRIITGLTTGAGQARAEHAGRQNARAFLEEVLEKWTLLRPPMNLAVNWTSAGPAPDIIGAETVRQTLINIFNNAADASPQAVEIDASWNQDALTIEVKDRGAGIDEEVSAEAGRRPISTKAPGRGLGLFLANATVERIGGNVTLFNREGGGGCARITIPLAGSPA